MDRCEAGCSYFVDGCVQEALQGLGYLSVVWIRVNESNVESDPACISLPDLVDDLRVVSTRDRIAELCHCGVVHGNNDCFVGAVPYLVGRPGLEQQIHSLGLKGVERIGQDGDREEAANYDRDTGRE